MCGNSVVDGTKVTMRCSSDGNFYIITTFSRKWGKSSSLYLYKETLDRHILSRERCFYVEADGETYANVSTCQQGMVDINILWLNFSGDYVKGHREKIEIENNVFLDLKEGEEKSFLYKTPLNATKYITNEAHLVIKNVLKNKRAKSALKRYFRNHYVGKGSPAGKLFLYGDGEINFSFRYVGPFITYNGGIILSEYRKNGWPCMEYNTHT